MSAPMLKPGTSRGHIEGFGVHRVLALRLFQMNVIALGESWAAGRGEMF